MNQTIKKNSVPSRGKPSPARQPSANALRRPKRCHLCQKMFAADKYVQIISNIVITLRILFQVQRWSKTSDK